VLHFVFVGDLGLFREEFCVCLVFVCYGFWKFYSVRKVCLLSVRLLGFHDFLFEWKKKIAFIFTSVRGLRRCLGCKIQRRGCSVKISFPAACTVLWLASCGEAGLGSEPANGDRGRGQLRPLVPAHQPAPSRGCNLLPLPGAKLPATPWTDWDHGALCQASLGLLSLYASWWVLQSTVLPTLLTLTPTWEWGRGMKGRKHISLHCFWDFELGASR
jgi:hypothetical protein